MGKVIKEMTEEEFNKVFNDAFYQMRKQYPMMTCGDMQTVAVISEVFKEMNLIEK